MLSATGWKTRVVLTEARRYYCSTIAAKQRSSYQVQTRSHAMRETHLSSHAELTLASCPGHQCCVQLPGHRSSQTQCQQGHMAQTCTQHNTARECLDSTIGALEACTAARKVLYIGAGTSEASNHASTVASKPFTKPSPSLPAGHQAVVSCLEDE